MDFLLARAPLRLRVFERVRVIVSANVSFNSSERECESVNAIVNTSANASALECVFE